MKIRHPPIKGEKVPAPLVGKGLSDGYFRANRETREFYVFTY